MSFKKWIKKPENKHLAGAIMCFGVMWIMTIALTYNIAYSTAFQEGVQSTVPKEPFWEAVDEVPFLATVKFFIIIVGIGFAIGKVLHG